MLHALCALFLFALSPTFWHDLLAQTAFRTVAVAGSVTAIIKVIRKVYPNLSGPWALLANLVLSICGILAGMPPANVFSETTTVQLGLVIAAAGGFHNIWNTIRELFPQKEVKKQVPSTPASKGGTLPAIVALALIPLLVLTGCTPQEQQQTVVGLTTALGTAITTLENIEGNSAMAAKLQTDFQAAIAAESNWKSGTPAQDVMEALNIVQLDLNLLPVSSTDTALIDLGIGLVDQILALLPAPAVVVPTSATATIVPAAFYGGQHSGSVRRRHPGLRSPIVSAKDFKKRWNAIVKQHPELAAAKVK